MKYRVTVYTSLEEEFEVEADDATQAQNMVVDDEDAVPFRVSDQTNVRVSPVGVDAVDYY